GRERLLDQAEEDFGLAAAGGAVQQERGIAAAAAFDVVERAALLLRQLRRLLPGADLRGAGRPPFLHRPDPAPVPQAAERVGRDAVAAKLAGGPGALSEQRQHKGLPSGPDT